ncbi:MAG: group 1 truncated hemoglobin [Zoogloeaceae bacterium]|nr:group 1 truncated hemoglobin [Pseudazoarcus pumilus]MDX5446127.1 group 1 truncated hemoglobin [Zoogloeaceae bacterium]
MAEASLYQKLGGMPAVNLAVDMFYDKVLADDRLKHFFAGLDMGRMRDHQKKFLTYAFGGTATYDGKNMRDAHARLVTNMGLNDTHFDAVVENLAAVLTELGVAPELIGEVAGIAESVRNDVLCR